MTKGLIFILILLFWGACSKTETFPERISQNFDRVDVIAGQQTSSLGLNALLVFVQKFENKDETFNLNAFQKNWQIVAANTEVELKDTDDYQLWTNITALLLELTQKEKYAAELERVSGNDIIGSHTIKPYIFTQGIGKIYVNLFQESEISYTHSMKGEVTIRQETDYPKSGGVVLYFGMTERRYVELYIRIPSWAKGSSVTVKQVKYFAEPGNYSKIVKKWKDGDVVEIEFPIELMPRNAHLVSSFGQQNSELNLE